MRKLFLLMSLCFITLLSAQKEINPSLKKDGFSIGLNSTNLGFSTVRESGVRNINMGIELGWFVVDKLQAVGGMGYQNTYSKDLGTSDEKFTYMGGFKYYVEGVLPVQLDFNGDNQGNKFVGTQLGYAFFPSNNFSIEPMIRYNIATELGQNDVFSAGLGFNYFFR